MSDVMEQAVLRMPPNLWTDDAIDVRQRHARYVQAADDLEALRKEREKIIDLLEWFLTSPNCTCRPRSDEWHDIFYTCSCGHDEKMKMALDLVASKYKGE